MSRVEGTYEFEVQPLREYFAARHLYSTAPYSPCGSECHGTLPDRFDALSRDFFWLNVTRFYAGCYSKGELPSLVDRLDELSRATGYKNTKHPQQLAATLLTDWVFAQHPKSMKQVVALILDGIGLRYLSTSGPRYRRREPLVLPKQSGSEELVERCFELLRSNPATDYAWMLAELIRANCSRTDITKRWLEPLANRNGLNVTTWLGHGLRLGVVSNLKSDDLESLLTDSSPDTPLRLSLILRGGQYQFIESDDLRWRSVVDYQLNTTHPIGFSRHHSLIENFLQALDPHKYGMAFENRSPEPIREIWDRHILDEKLDEPPQDPTPRGFDIAQKCSDIVAISKRLSNRSSVEWATGLAHWNELVENARQRFGDRWLLYVLANTSAGIRSKTETCDEASELHDKSMPLCRRTRYARLRAGNPNWWASQLTQPQSPDELTFTLLVLITWAGASVFEKQLGLIDTKLRSLGVEQWKRLMAAVNFGCNNFGSDRRDVRIDVSAIDNTLSERTIVAISTRVSGTTSNSMFLKCMQEYDGDDLAVLNWCLLEALNSARRHPEGWRNWLLVVSKSYAKSGASAQYYGYKFFRILRSQKIPYEIAEEIIQNCENYPLELMELAEEVCREHIAENVTPVGLVAKRQHWFN